MNDAPDVISLLPLWDFLDVINPSCLYEVCAVVTTVFYY